MPLTVGTAAPLSVPRSLPWEGQVGAGDAAARLADFRSRHRLDPGPEKSGRQTPRADTRLTPPNTESIWAALGVSANSCRIWGLGCVDPPVCCRGTRGISVEVTPLGCLS